MTSVHRVAVAFSGGRDSTALLHATARSAQALQSEGLLLEVVALHVHHGLSEHADAWLAHTRQFCASLVEQGLPVHWRAERLTGAPAMGESVEAWARAGRHEALARMAKEEGADLLLLAHHRRDQAETFLLQALRGAGAAGLSAMPSWQQREHLCWARPWLHWSREQVEGYVRAFSLPFVEDDSNADPRFARNRLRLGPWPVLLQSFPDAEATLAQSSAWAQEALALQQELVAIDLPQLLDADAPHSLDWQGLRRLSPARQSNALRAWLYSLRSQPAPAALVRRLLVEADGQGRWSWSDGWLHAYRGRLYWQIGASLGADLETMDAVLPLSITGAGEWPVAPFAGRLQMRPVVAGGVALSWLSTVQLRGRMSGVQFQAHGKGVPRSLKKCFQSAGVPVWQRQAPLLYAGDTLLFVPGLGVDARVQAGAGEPQLMPQWLPDAAC